MATAGSIFGAPAMWMAGFLGGLLSLLPPQAAEFIGDELALASTRGVIAFGYLHPLFLTILSAWTIRVACGALAGPLFHLVSAQWGILLSGFVGGTIAYLIQRRLRQPHA